MTSAFFFSKDVDGSGEFIVWNDRSWFGKNLATLDLVVGDTTEKSTNVVASFREVKGLTEHFKTGDNGFLGWFDTNDFNFVVDVSNTTFDTASNDSTTARDGHDVFDRH